MSDVTLHLGDCLSVMAGLPENSVDTIITDPPYGLTFMGKDWDRGVPGVAFWREALRVAKPGAMLLAMGGTRTFHRLVVAIEDAGWEVRDSMAWLYGSGFPKSHNISKGIDKRRNDDLRPVCRFVRMAMDRQNFVSRDIAPQFGFDPRMIDHWAARDTDSQPSIPQWEQWLKLKEILKLSDDMDAEVWRLNGRKGTPGDNWDKREVVGQRKQRANSENSAIPMNASVGDVEFITAPSTPAAQLWHGWGTALKPAMELICVAMKPIDGTYVNNALTWGVAGLWIDGGRVGSEGGTQKGNPPKGESNGIYGNGINGACGIIDIGKGRFPANVIHDGSDEVTGLFPQGGSNNGYTPANTDKSNANGKVYGFANYPDMHKSGAHYGDSGSAARFFMACKQDDLCSLCLTPKHSIMSDIDNSEVIRCKNISANNVEKNLTTTQATIQNIAQENVPDWLIEKAVHFAKSVGNLCDSCATSIVREVAEVKTWDFNKGVSQVIQDFIGNSNECILIQNLAHYAGLMESIDTTPTTTSLSKLFGCASRVITNYIQETEKTAPKRFLYTAKASRSERNAGLEGMPIRPPGGLQGRHDGSLGGNPVTAQNHHPTVKPLALMRYLARLTKTPTGGVVLDPFMGSGTTGIAAVLEGRDFIGIELNPEYLEIAEKRIAEAQKQLRLPLEAE